jgi:hypothetical protein
LGLLGTERSFKKMILPSTIVPSAISAIVHHTIIVSRCVALKNRTGTQSKCKSARTILSGTFFPPQRERIITRSHQSNPANKNTLSP